MPASASPRVTVSPTRSNGTAFQSTSAFGIDASLENRDLEHRLRRSAHAESRDRLALDVLEVLEPGFLRREQAAAAAMRADEQLDVEALLERLQPIADETGARVGLAGGDRLDHRLAVRGERIEFDVEVVLGVDALRHAEAERRMAGRDVAPAEADFRRRPGDRRREDLAAEHAGRGSDADGADGLEDVAPR